MVNIFTPTPRTQPSVLNSIAGETTALANPVMGTRVPPPPNLAMLSYMPRAVSTAERNISETEHSVLAAGVPSPAHL